MLSRVILTPSPTTGPTTRVRHGDRFAWKGAAPVKVYECECGYRSLQGGRCRSHPYPARAMGPNMGDPVEYVRVSDVVEALDNEGSAIERGGDAADFIEREFAAAP